MGNKTYIIQAKTIQELKEKIDNFINSNPEYNVFATPFCWNPHQSVGEEYYIGGYDCIVWYSFYSQEGENTTDNKPFVHTSSFPDTSSLGNYDSAKLDKVNKKNKGNLPASEKQIKYLLGLGYKGSIENLTVLQAKRLIEGFVGKEKR